LFLVSFSLLYIFPFTPFPPYCLSHFILIFSSSFIFLVTIQCSWPCFWLSMWNWLRLACSTCYVSVIPFPPPVLQNYTLMFFIFFTCVCFTVLNRWALFMMACVIPCRWQAAQPGIANLKHKYILLFLIQKVVSCSL
jgi:hypothetical protein